MEAAVYILMNDAMEPGVELLDRNNRFVSDNLRRIFLQIYGIVRNVADAQDLTQEAFIKALQQHELRDFLQSRTLRSRQRFCRRTGLSLLGQEPPAFRRPHPDHSASPRRTVP